MTAFLSFIGRNDPKGRDRKTGEPTLGPLLSGYTERTEAQGPYRLVWLFCVDNPEEEGQLRLAERVRDFILRVHEAKRWEAPTFVVERRVGLDPTDIQEIAQWVRSVDFSAASHLDIAVSSGSPGMQAALVHLSVNSLLPCSTTLWRSIDPEFGTPPLVRQLDMGHDARARIIAQIEGALKRFDWVAAEELSSDLAEMMGDATTPGVLRAISVTGGLAKLEEGDLEGAVARFRTYEDGNYTEGKLRQIVRSCVGDLEMLQARERRAERPDDLHRPIFEAFQLYAGVSIRMAQGRVCNAQTRARAAAERLATAVLVRVKISNPTLNSARVAYDSSGAVLVFPQSNASSESGDSASTTALVGAGVSVRSEAFGKRGLALGAVAARFKAVSRSAECKGPRFFGGQMCGYHVSDLTMELTTLHALAEALGRFAESLNETYELHFGAVRSGQDDSLTTRLHEIFKLVFGEAFPPPEKFPFGAGFMTKTGAKLITDLKKGE